MAAAALAALVTAAVAGLKPLHGTASRIIVETQAEFIAYSPDR